MKKFISVMLCICICLCSTVFCFADFTSTDSTTLSNIYKYMPTASQITTLNNTLSTINTRVLNIYNALFDSNHSVAYWVHSISTWMQPIYGRLEDIITNSLNIEAVAGLLGSTEVVSGTTVRTPYLFYNGKSVAQWENIISDDLKFSINKNRTLRALWSDGKYRDYAYSATDSYLGNVYYVLEFYGNQLAQGFQNLEQDYKNTQNYTAWDSLSSSSFTPTSVADGIYKWFSKIQTPVARLSYVLASDERLEAQEAAAANEEAVVDNFIDSSGSGSASPSDIGSVSNLSSGFKDNIATDASVSGIWNIFNSDNFGWFSQETANQLDTTNSGKRTLRSSGNYPTPLLDQQTEDIIKYIGGDKND